MAELLRNAWTGWFRVTDSGKIMALFLAALLYLWLGHKQEKQRLLLRYSTVSALCCVIPVTAVVLMLYQTRFYDYEWIWSIVPVTILTAYAGTNVLSEYWQGFRREAWRKGLPVTVGLLAAAFLCGGPSSAGVDRSSERDWKKRTENILEIVNTEAEDILTFAGTEDSGICIWAPRKMMEYARRLDGSILLPYGRDMWEGALGAYSYDTYSEELRSMYLWMCVVEETCTDDDIDITDVVVEKMEEQELSTEGCLNTAKKAGVNFLILPENMNRKLLDDVTDFIGVQPEEGWGYYYFQL